MQSVLAKISVCRTNVLGGRKFRCGDCDEFSSLYNSCGDRHCPQCSGGKRVDFNEKASKLILPEVDYYQVVFTLPSELSELALANPMEMSDLLVHAGWKSLSKNIKDEQDYDPAAITVLHSWNQKLESHWHVHMLVPGEGPCVSRDGWKRSEAPPEVRNSTGHYLVDRDRLCESYRKSAIRKLRRLRALGKLKFGGKFEYLRSDENWEVFVKNLESKNWVAYIQPPPTEESTGGEVVHYLTRYLTGGPISNYRIVRADHHEVTFLAREGKRVGGDRGQVEVTLPIEEFVRRWCLHIQPDQLTKSRYLGGWSNNRQQQYMSRCRELLAERGIAQVIVESDQNEMADTREEGPDLVCPHCGSDRLEMIERTAKPSWKELFWRENASCPSWYSELQWADHRTFWTDAYGSEFYDWYLETQVEGAKESEPESSHPIQLALFDSTAQRSFLVDSF